MYHATDPRAALAATSAGSKPAATQFAGAEYAKFYEQPPMETKDGARTWYARGQQHGVGHRAIERRVLLVDHDKVVAQRAEDLGRVRGGRLDERADDGLPRGKAAAK